MSEPQTESPQPGRPARVPQSTELVPTAEKPTNLPRMSRAGDLLKPVTNAILERRATYHFGPEPVADELLDAILSLAAQAPSGFNLQPWRFLVLREPGRKQRLRRAIPDQPALLEAPVVIVALGLKDYEQYARAVLEEGARRGLGQPSEVDERLAGVLDLLAAVPGDVWANRHTMVAVSFLMLAAECYGFDTLAAECFDAKTLRRELELPEHAEVVALVGIGRRAGPEKPYPGRFPLSSIVFDETWGTPWKPSTSPLAPRQKQDPGFENE